MNTTQKKFIKEKLIPFILREQGRGFIMGDVLLTGLTPGEVESFDGISRKIPSCGIVGCIKGSIEYLKKKESGIEPIEMTTILGLTPEQQTGLFYHWFNGRSEYGTGWPKDLVTKWVQAKTPYRKARVAVQLLNRVIKTNGKCLER